jgi:hypothetical protein
MRFTYRCLFLNCLDFQGPPLPMALAMDLPPSGVEGGGRCKRYEINSLFFIWRLDLMI